MEQGMGNQFLRKGVFRVLPQGKAEDTRLRPLSEGRPCTNDIHPTVPIGIYILN